MNEEEKKAVKYFYNLRATIDESNMLFDEEINVKHGKETIKQITIILNLIEKLQKENEELRVSNKKLYEIGQEMCKQDKYTSENYIPVQKVKDKIEKEIKYHERNILEIENITMLKSKTDKEEVEIEFNKYVIVVLKKILQELIEEREN